MSRDPAFRSGFVAIVGRPNVGKSTLVNALVGGKAAIVSDKPQTTRNSIRAVLNDPRGQIVFVDTPGLHRPLHTLGRFMERQAAVSLEMADVVCFMVEAGDSRIGKADGIILDLLQRVRVPVVLIVNKVDVSGPPGADDGWKCFTGKREFAHVLLVSALEGRNLDLLLEVLFSLLLPGPPIFDDERLVDCTERFIAAEVIREKVLEHTDQEVPHSVAVVVEEFKSPEEYPDRRNLLVRATLFVERAGQKAILIGRGGTKLKRIGEHARKEVEEVFGYDVYLDLWVKVRPGWRNSEKELRRLGYT